jgi:hypothetical protein
MVVGFKTTYAISAYHHQLREIEPRTGSILHFVRYFLAITEKKNKY